MENLSGIVSGVRNTINVSGSGGSNGTVTTTYISIFKINGQPVKIKTSQPMAIDDGDEVLVVGKINGNTFNALACKNLTTGEEGSLNGVLMAILGVIFLIAGVCGIVFFSDPFFGDFPILIGLIFIGVSVYSLYSGSQIFNALKELRKLSLIN